MVEEKVVQESTDIKEELTEKAKIDDFVESSAQPTPKEEEQEIDLPKVDVGEITEYIGDIAGTFMGLDPIEKDEYVKKFKAINTPALKMLGIDRHLARLRLFLPRPLAFIIAGGLVFLSAITIGKAIKARRPENKKGQDQPKRKVGDQYVPTVPLIVEAPKKPSEADIHERSDVSGTENG